mgnify:CR=1 FL=1
MFLIGETSHIIIVKVSIRGVWMMVKGCIVKKFFAQSITQDWLDRITNIMSLVNTLREKKEKKKKKKKKSCVDSGMFCDWEWLHLESGLAV